MVRRLLLALFGVAALIGPGLAGQPLEQSRLHASTAWADRVVVGRVASIELDDVKAKPVPGVAHDVTYRIVRIAVEDTLAGAGGRAVSEVRVGLPVKVANDPETALGPFVRGAEGLFFLRLHHTDGFYTVEEFVPKGHPRYAPDRATAQRYLKLLANPRGSLLSKEPADRLTVAALLLIHYRATHGYMVKTAPIPADENKLILAALVEADWNAEANPIHPWGFAYEMWLLSDLQPGKVFKLPVIPDGTRTERTAFLKNWLLKNQHTYRIERYVPE